MTGVIGPLESGRQALDLPEVRAIYATARPGSPPGSMDEAGAALAGRACEAAGVTLGAYDRAVLAWLGTWGPQTCAAVAGMIGRAGLIARANLSAVEAAVNREPVPHGSVALTRDQADTVLAALQDAAAFKRELADQPCEDCDRHPAGLCETCATRMDRAEEYQRLSALLASQEETR